MFQQISIHPNFQQKMSQVVGTHYSPFMHALEYKKWASIIIYIEQEMQPNYYFCLKAADTVNKNNCSHEALIQANSFKSTFPNLGFKIEPMKKSKKKFPDILTCLLLSIPQKQIIKATKSPLIIDVTIILPKLSMRNVIGKIPVQCKINTKARVKYQLYKALQRYSYCLLFYEGTGNPLTTGPGNIKARTN